MVRCGNPTAIPAPRRQRQGISRVSWLAGLVRCELQVWQESHLGKKQRTIEEDIQCKLPAYTHVNVNVCNVCTPHTDIDMQKKKKG